MRQGRNWVLGTSVGIISPLISLNAYDAVAVPATAENGLEEIAMTGNLLESTPP
jgi:hypothetical protein